MQNSKCKIAIREQALRREADRITDLNQCTIHNAQSADAQGDSRRERKGAKIFSDATSASGAMTQSALRMQRAQRFFVGFTFDRPATPRGSYALAEARAGDKKWTLELTS